MQKYANVYMSMTQQLPSAYNSAPRSLHVQPEGQNQPGIQWGRRLAAATGVAVIGMAGYHAISHEHSPVPAPQELRVDGVIDMDEVRGQLERASPAQIPEISLDSTGVKVIKLAEYVPRIGRPLTGDAEFVGEIETQVAGVQENLDKVVAADADLLNSLAWGGKIDAIQFNMAVDPNDKTMEGRPYGDMRFIPAGKDKTHADAVIEYTLPATGKVPLEFMAEMQSHEATHIEERPLLVVDKSEKELRSTPKETVVDTEEYRQDLAELRKESIDVASHNPEVISAAKEVLAVNAGINTPVAEQERKIAQAILDGTYNALQPTNERPSKNGDLRVDEGKIVAPWFEEYYDSGLTSDQRQATKPEQVQAMVKLDDTFETALSDPESPLALFDESTYLNAPDTYGHPKDNLAEAIAGARNALRSYPRRLAERLKKLPGHARQIVLHFLKRVNADTEQTIKDTGYESRASEKVINQTRENLDWIEKQTAEEQYVK